MVYVEYKEGKAYQGIGGYAKAKKLEKERAKATAQAKAEAYERSFKGQFKSKRLTKFKLPKGRIRKEYIKSTKGIRGLLTQFVGVGLPRGARVAPVAMYEKGEGKRGRPKGTYKYAIPGKGLVSIKAYKKYMSAMRAKQRLMYSQQIQRPQYQRLPQQVARVPYQEYPQMQQVQRPVSTNILHAQNVFQPRGQQGVPNTILQAPNVFKGELRNVGSGSSYPSYDEVHKPIVNPDGDYYTDTDLLTGRAVLKRRIRERYLSQNY